MLEIFNGRDKFYQWDVGQKLIVDDSIIAVHYDNGTGDALVCPVYEYEGKYVADVPNIMLQTDWNIKCYAYCGECVRASRIYEVERRNRPDDYIYSETETLRYSSLLEMINATNDELATVEQSLEASIADIAAEHNKDMETVEQQLVATNADVAAAQADIDELEKRAQYIQNTSLPNAQGKITWLDSRLTTAEKEIDALQASGGSGTGGGGVIATPDWNENNPDSPAYIKNRTHYEEMGVKGTLLAERSPDSIEEGAAYFMYPCLEAEPQAGMTYKINWNGTEYLCVALDSQEAVGEAGYVLLGNIGMISGGTPTAEPFVIMMPYEEIAAKQGVALVCVMLDGATQITLSISYDGDVIHKIDNKYLNLSAYAKLDYVNEVKASMEGLFANYYPKTTIDNKFNIEYFATGGISNLTGRNEGYQAAVGQIEELITYVDIPAAAANDEYILTLGYSSSKTDLMCQYQTEGGIVAGEKRILKFYVRRIGKHIFVKIYKPSANGFTDVIEDVLFINKSETYTNPRYVSISTVSGNNFPDGTTIKGYQRTAAKGVN